MSDNLKCGGLHLGWVEEASLAMKHGERGTRCRRSIRSEPSAIYSAPSQCPISGCLTSLWSMYPACDVFASSAMLL